MGFHSTMVSDIQAQDNNFEDISSDELPFASHSGENCFNCTTLNNAPNIVEPALQSGIAALELEQANMGPPPNSTEESDASDESSSAMNLSSGTQKIWDEIFDQI